MKQATVPGNLDEILRDFFCCRMIQQRRVSHETVVSYRDTFRLLLTFAESHLGKKAVDLSMNEMDTTLVLAFLNYLETARGNCIRTRNTRLAAIRSFLNYAALKDPTSLASIKQVLTIPMKRFDRPTVPFLTWKEIDAILQAPNTKTWSGKRDQALFTLLYNTGARVSEIIGAKRLDVESVQCKSLLIHGKGRKDRVVPLLKGTTRLLHNWLSYIEILSETPLFPNRFGNCMSRSGVEKRLRRAVAVAKDECPSLAARKVSPHVLRHTTAAHLLLSGVDLSIIAILLGHESIATTHHYIDANMEMKEKALAVLQNSVGKMVRFKPQNDIIDFLNSL